MRTVLMALLVAGVLVAAFNSCKKCYHCYNECVNCSIKVGNNTFTQLLCSDSFENKNSYQAAITAAKGAGFNCSQTEPTYSFRYCISKEGDEFYQQYFNKNQRVTCEEK